MPGSLAALRLKNLMLGNGITGSQLDTELSRPATLGSYRAMMALPFEENLLLTNEFSLSIILTSGIAFGELSDDNVVSIMQSADDTATMATSTNTLLTILTTASTYEAIRQDGGSAYTNLKAQVNAGGSKLKRDILTSSGDFTFHTSNTLAALSIATVSGGGASPNGATSGSGGGSGGGLSLLLVDQGSLPSANTPYIIGVGGITDASSATASNFGAFNSVTAGADGTLSQGGFGVGGGTDANTGDLKIDVDILNAAWQGNLTESTHQGGGGGGLNTDGQDGFDGTGGGAFNSISTPGDAGFSPGAGGGGGGSAAGTGSGGTAISPNYGAGAGGAVEHATTSNPGGNGFQGVAIAYYVIN